MDRKRSLLVIGLVVVLTLLWGSQTGQAVSRPPTKGPSSSVVLLIAADEGRGGRLIPKWSGAGALISPDGLVLTNCQVAFPKAVWNDPEFEYDVLLVVLAQDKPPSPAYIGEVAQYDASLDLAVVRIVQSLDGTPVDPKKLNLPALSVGDSDQVAVGDTLSVWGYDGAGIHAAESTEVQVEGFSSGRGIKGRAWISVRPELGGELSGGPALNEDGEVVAVVAVGAAGSADDVTHCRYAEDTNGNGTLDADDTCTGTGGSISAVRPVNLAEALIRAAGQNLAPPPTPAPAPTPKKPPPKGGGDLEGVFGPITFAEGVDRNDNPVRPGTTFQKGISELYGFVDYQGMQEGWTWAQRWYIDGELLVEGEEVWDYDEFGESGENFWVRIASRGALPEGEYQLDLLVEGELVQTATCKIVGKAPRPSPTPTRPPSKPGPGGGVEVYGRITDAGTGEGIPSALFIVLKPGVTLEAFIRANMDESLVYSWAVTDRNGDYRLNNPLVRGETYSMLAGARGYLPIGDDGVHIPEDLPSPYEVNIQLERAK